jgi:hypothetical protein
MTAYRALEASGQPRGPAALSPVPIGGWVGFRSDLLAVVERGWLVRINITVRNFAHPSATDTGCTRPHFRSTLKSAIIIFTVYLYTLVVSGLPRAIISDLMTNTGEGVRDVKGGNPRRTCGRGV